MLAIYEKFLIFLAVQNREGINISALNSITTSFLRVELYFFNLFSDRFLFGSADLIKLIR